MSDQKIQEAAREAESRIHDAIEQFEKASGCVAVSAEWRLVETQTMGEIASPSVPFCRINYRKP